MGSDANIKKYLFTNKFHRDIYPAIDPTKSGLSLAGKVVVLTGAGRGIGLGIAKVIAQANPKTLVIAGRKQADLDEASAAIRAVNANIQVVAVPTDISSKESVANLYSRIAAEAGAADVLINNAGRMHAGGLIGDADDDDWWADYEVNVGGTFRMAAHWVRATRGRRTTVINVASVPAVNPHYNGYFGSKLAITRFSEQLAAEHPDVAVFAVHPGVVETDMMVDAIRPVAGDTPELMGGYAVWLAAKRPEWLSGRWTTANWDVDSMETKKEEVLEGDLLKLKVVGNLGPHNLVAA